jgi:hypothetical protein
VHSCDHVAEPKKSALIFKLVPMAIPVIGLAAGAFAVIRNTMAIGLLMSALPNIWAALLLLRHRPTAA